MPAGLSLKKGILPNWNIFFTSVLLITVILVVSFFSLKLRMINLIILLAASVALSIRLFYAMLGTTPIEPRLYFAAAFMFIVAFNILNIRWALACSIVLYLAYVMLARAHSGNPALLIDLAILGVLVGYFSVFGKVSEERAEALTFQRLAHTDGLTGLENRRAMYQRLERIMANQALKNHASIILLDIDHFKQVNDRYGHSVGDQILQRVAVVMNGVIRDDDVIARWGGEEFLILLSSGRASIDIEVGDRILHSLRAAPMPLSLHMTASCGICRLDEVESLSEWLACADERLYTAKKLGRDRLQYL